MPRPQSDHRSKRRRLLDEQIAAEPQLPPIALPPDAMPLPLDVHIDKVLALRPTPALQERLEALLEKNRNDGLSPDERREWDHYQSLEHLVRLAKANAARKLKENKKA